MDWCRLWHDAPDDPKWRLIARKAGVRVGDVWAVWTRMMVRASASSERGMISGWDDEVEAVALDFEPEDVTAIREAMQGRVLDGDRLSGWDKRQPKRERVDDSRDRVAAHRQRQKAQETAIHDDVTPCNASDDTETPRGEERREEKNIPPSPIGDVPPRSKNSRGSRLPDDWTPDEADSAFAAEHGVDANIEAEKFRDHWHSKAGRGAVWLDWHAKWRSWVRDAKEINTKRNGAPKRDPTAGPVQRRVPTEAEYRTATRKWKSDGHWPQYLGPRPDMQSTRVPKHIRQEFGL